MERCGPRVMSLSTRHAAVVLISPDPREEVLECPGWFEPHPALRLRSFGAISFHSGQAGFGQASMKPARWFPESCWDHAQDVAFAYWYCPQVFSRVPSDSNILSEQSLGLLSYEGGLWPLLLDSLVKMPSGVASVTTVFPVVPCKYRQERSLTDASAPVE